MTKDENRTKLESMLRLSISPLTILGVTEEQQKDILRLITYDIDRAYDNGYTEGYYQASKVSLETIEKL